MKRFGVPKPEKGPQDTGHRDYGNERTIRTRSERTGDEYEITRLNDQPETHPHGQMGGVPKQ